MTFELLEKSGFVSIVACANNNKLTRSVVVIVVKEYSSLYINIVTYVRSIVFSVCKKKLI